MLSAARKIELKKQADRVCELIHDRYVSPAIEAYNFTDEERHFFWRAHGHNEVMQGATILGNALQIDREIMAAMVTDFMSLIYRQAKTQSE